MNTTLTRSCFGFPALVAAVLLSSCDPAQWLEDQTSANGGYMNNIGGQGGVKTDIPWDMRLGQGYWDDPGNLKGQSKIVINRKEQKAYFYKGDLIVGMTPVSVGSEGHDTPAGNYKILEKKPMHYSSTWGVARRKGTDEIVIKDFSPKASKLPAGCYYEPAKMPYALRIVGGYFMHVGYVPGYAASHGCIRVPEDMAKIFYDNAYKGMPVQII